MKAYRSSSPITAAGLTWRGTMILLALGMGSAAHGAAPDIQDLNAVTRVAHTFLGQEVAKAFPAHKIEIGKLDPRLKLAACEQALHAFLPPGSRLPGNTTVGVSCEGRKPWTVYLSAEVKAMLKVVVSQRPLVRGATISAEDIRLELREVGASQSYITELAHVQGKLVKRPMSANSVLNPSALASAPLIRRGQQIVIMASTPGIDVRMQGTALTDGGKGDRIPVRNALSKRTVEATVIQAGVVQVTM